MIGAEHVQRCVAFHAADLEIGDIGQVDRRAVDEAAALEAAGPPLADHEGIGQYARAGGHQR
ncbi:hypothetical protein PPH41_40000 [Burkholderia gladioli]|nr:hypothetical protein [Burkholderia gladioli]